jgi:glycosyltransferase involved in cell wall biosynthesis
MLAVLIGDGEEREKLVHMEGTNVMFKGFIPDAAQYLPAFDVFVLPSLKEGLPYVLLEAGHAQLPVVASRVGGIPEIVSHNCSGILVDPGDTSALAHALEQYRNDRLLARSYGSSLCDTVNIKFHQRYMIEETTALY